MNPLTNVRNIQNLNKRELELGVPFAQSWHQQYRDSAWVFIGGLDYDLSEGDIICMFSQYGEVVNVNLVRDKKTGKSKGFAFLCYENQMSTVLSIDNLNSCKLCGRTIRVDHVEEYKVPKMREDMAPEQLKMALEGCAPQVLSSQAEEPDTRNKKKRDKPSRFEEKKEKQEEKEVKIEAPDIVDGVQLPQRLFGGPSLVKTELSSPDRKTKEKKGKKNKKSKSKKSKKPKKSKKKYKDSSSNDSGSDSDSSSDFDGRVERSRKKKRHDYDEAQHRHAGRSRDRHSGDKHFKDHSTSERVISKSSRGDRRSRSPLGVSIKSERLDSDCRTPTSVGFGVSKTMKRELTSDSSDESEKEKFGNDGDFPSRHRGSRNAEALRGVSDKRQDRHRGSVMSPPGRKGEDYRQGSNSPRKDSHGNAGISSRKRDGSPNKEIPRGRRRSDESSHRNGSRRKDENDNSSDENRKRKHAKYATNDDDDVGGENRRRR